MRYLTINWFADAPVVEISPTNLTAIEGEEVMILCTYDSNPSLLTAVRWLVSVFSILEFSCAHYKKLFDWRCILSTKQFLLLS